MLEFTGPLSRRTALVSLEVACLLAAGCVRPRSAATEAGEPLPPATAEPAAPSPAVPAAEDPSIRDERASRPVEALRFEGAVLVREPRGVWTTLAAAHTVEGGRVRILLSSEVDHFGPRAPERVRWVEASAPRRAEEFAGTWVISGSVPSAGGAIGWRREYRLAADGSYTFSAYPQLSGEGSWHQREGALAQVVLDGTHAGEGVGLVRDEDLEPSEPGLLRGELVHVTQADTPPPAPSSDGPSFDPSRGPPPASPPPRTSVAQVTTDAEGALEVALEPWARQIVVVDRRQRSVIIAL